LLSGCKSDTIPVLIHNSIDIKSPLGGSSWATNGAKVTKNGLENWISTNQVCQVYFKVNRAGKLKLSIHGRAINSQIQVSISGFNKVVNFNEEDETMVGEWDILKPGYIEIKLKGIEKRGHTFREISDFGISGTFKNSEISFVKNNEGNYFYWGIPRLSFHFNNILKVSKS
jgi:hypothetical protein